MLYNNSVMVQITHSNEAASHLYYTQEAELSDTNINNTLGSADGLDPNMAPGRLVLTAGTCGRPPCRGGMRGRLSSQTQLGCSSPCSVTAPYSIAE
jgi:hypothetical protein